MQQAVWLRAWERRTDYDPERASLATFLSFIVRTVMGDHWRSLDKAAIGNAGPADELPCLKSEISLTDLRHDLAKVLTPLDLELIPLLEEGLTASEIASRLGLKLKTVANRLYAMRQRIKKYTT